MGEQDVCIVCGSETHHVLFGHFAERFSIQCMEDGHVHIGKAVFLYCPLYPLPHMLLCPYFWV